uniref:Peptidase S1 domain-containing protein n=1 Tax=Anopheles atroparvus TaxID=41427 RepID=A0AAG5CZE2_ANOAO
MQTKHLHVSIAFSARLQLSALLLLPVILGTVVHGQYLTSPCPSIFRYLRDQNTDQVFGYLELPNLRIGQVVKLNVDLSIGVAVPQNNVGSITLVKSKEQTFRDIYNNQPAQYRVNFPFRNLFPNLLEIRVNGQPICIGQKATGQIVTTINLDHTLLTKLETVSNGNGNNVYAIQFQPAPLQTPRPVIYTPTVQIRSQLPPQPQFVQTRQPSVAPRPATIKPRPQTVNLQAVQSPRPQPQSIELCGKPAAIYSRLSINGKRSAKGQFPWAVPIFDKRNSLKPKYICGSTIITKYHLLTAAHCMYDDYRARQASELLTTPGMYNIDDFLEPDIQRRYVASIVVHPEYYSNDDGKAEYDIAVMGLRQAIIYNNLVRPICLWDGIDNLEDVIGKQGLVSGWGVTENGAAKRPSYVHAKVVSHNQCRRQLGNIFSPDKGMFCADGHGEVPCTGDSGSGLVLKQGQQFFIRGIVSIGQYSI